MQPLAFTVHQQIWDSWNVTHIARHGVIPDEAEDVCSSQSYLDFGYSGRIRLVGQTKSGKFLSVVLAPKEKEIFYPVTTRPASRKERRLYQESKGGDIKND